MKMHNPPHPGEIIKGLWLEPMGINSKTLSGIINGKRSITPEIAIRLSIALGSSPESWMGHQVSYDLWQAEKNRNKLNVTSLIVNTECA
ncbi:antitoxin HigA-1 [Candidatus Magnetomoraceae bacterium gMMP-1]